MDLQMLLSIPASIPSSDTQRKWFASWWSTRGKTFADRISDFFPCSIICHDHHGGWLIGLDMEHCSQISKHKYYEVSLQRHWSGLTCQFKTDSEVLSRRLSDSMAIRGAAKLRTSLSSLLSCFYLSLQKNVLPKERVSFPISVCSNVVTTSDLGKC